MNPKEAANRRRVVRILKISHGARQGKFLVFSRPDQMMRGLNISKTVSLNPTYSVYVNDIGW